jgi:DNA repair protein RecN (Recombination protein N)
MLRNLSLRDFVIVRELDVNFSAGFSVLTGETGAGKSILIDALQLALGGRGDAMVVRDGAPRTDIAATFDVPTSLQPWLIDAGMQDAGDDSTLLLRRSIDAQGRSRAWINGVPASVTQLREAADHLVDIHGQHAWQSLTRPAAVRNLLDSYGGVSTTALAAAWAHWQANQRALDLATSQASDRERERERLTWQLSEVDKLNPGADEWPLLNEEHKRLANAQALIDAAQTAQAVVSEADANAEALVARAADAIQDVVDVDPRLQSALDVLRSAQAQLNDASHTLRSYLQHTDLDPQRLSQLDERLSSWMSLAKRFRTQPAELAALHASWKLALQAMDAAGDTAALAQAAAQAERQFMSEAKLVSQGRQAAAPSLARSVTGAMQALGMSGGQFAIQLDALPEPQAHGLESAEFLVAGHAGSTPRPIGKVASGGELSRLALAIAVTACERKQQDAHSAGTLIFDEIDSGVGGSVADTVGQLMQKLGINRQVLAVTHLAQVAACANQHFVVSKAAAPGGGTQSAVRELPMHDRTAEIARMLGGEKLNTSTAHAKELLERAQSTVATASGATKTSKATARPVEKPSKAATQAATQAPTKAAVNKAAPKPPAIKGSKSPAPAKGSRKQA